MYKQMLFILTGFIAMSQCVCCLAYAESFLKDITDKNFREKASVWELDNYHFYEPQLDDMWQICTRAAEEGDNFIFDQCKLKEFKKKSDLDIKYYQIGFDSTMPIKREWLDTVMQEVFNQEGFSYFTIYYTCSMIQHVGDAKSEQDLDYKICQNEKKSKKNTCVHNLSAHILAYNDPKALRNGIIHDAGQTNGGLYMFYDIYMSAGIEKVEKNNYLWIADYTKQAWEVAQKVDPQKNNPKVKYNIERHSKSILAEHDNDPVDFSKEFQQCKERFVSRNNGRFSKQDECYCNCVQEQVNKNVKKLSNPNKLVVEIIETSYEHCDWLKNNAVYYESERLNELKYKTNPLSDFYECEFKVFAKYVDNVFDKEPINICNVEEIILHLPECSSKISKK